MVIPLHGRSIRPLSHSAATPLLGRLCETPDIPSSARHQEILLVRTTEAPLADGYLAYLLHSTPAPSNLPADVYCLAPEMHYLRHGDIVRLDPQRRTLNVLYRRDSPSNSFLVTERCDNYCLMCSQPPKVGDDDWLLDELLAIIPLVSPDTQELGVTGGEPTLLGERFLDLICALKKRLPCTAIHVLTNGRRFADETFARALAALAHPDLLLGVPLYSDLASEHDHVVQALGAYNETIRGIINLKRWGVRVELRIVVHAHTWKRLPEFARFVGRNLLFVDHVALMGLELTGFAKANIDALWIDPVAYQPELSQAAHALERAGMTVSIYNHQLCVLDARLHHLARRSISDWKNIYHSECEDCVRRSECGGFFASSTLRRSSGIRPFTNT